MNKEGCGQAGSPKKRGVITRIGDSAPLTRLPLRSILPGWSTRFPG